MNEFEELKENLHDVESILKLEDPIEVDCYYNDKKKLTEKIDKKE